MEKVMKKDTTKDMTQGSPMKLILGFSVPLLFGFLFQQLYSMVDTIIVGRFLGVNALAGVGSTGSLNFLIIGFCMGVCNGFAIPLAHMFGAKDYSGLRRFMANGVWLSILFSAVMTVLTTVFCRQMLTAMKTPEDIFAHAYGYIFIIFLGIPATYLYNMLSGIIRAMGDSKTPLVFLTLSSVLNIALDLVCILVLHMGVAGAAVATVASQAVSGVLCLIYMVYKFPLLRVKKEEWRMNLPYMKTLCGMGVPMGLQYSITAIGSVILQSAVNTLGASAVASVTAAGRVSMFFCCPYDGLYYGHLWGAECGGKEAGAFGAGDKGMYEDCCGLLGDGTGYTVFLRCAVGFPFRGHGGQPAFGRCQAAFGGEQHVLYTSCSGEYCTVFDPGNGLWNGCDSGRGLRDGGQRDCRPDSGTGLRVCRSLLCQSVSVDICRCVFDSGLYPFAEEAG